MGGAVSTALVVGMFALAAVRPPIPRRPTPFNLQFALGWWINEAPFLGVLWLAAGTAGFFVGPVSGGWWAVVAIVVADLLLLGWIAVRARTARPALSQALRTVYGPDAAPRRTRPPWWRLLLPVLSWRPDVRRVRNVRYGPARLGNRLDVHVPRRERSGGPAPVLVYSHGRGGTRWFGHALMYDLAARGWVCVTVGRRRLGVGHREQLDDTRAALAWVREHAASYGGDPDRIVGVGGSAGANLTATAALTGSPVAAVVGLYGYYGAMGRGVPSPEEAITAEAPPFLVVHGTHDSLVPLPRARDFADRLRAVSRQPVVWAELPGAQHSFDAVESIRVHAVRDAIVRFAEVALPDRQGEGGRPAR